jgi:hypothetical protein
MIIVQHQEEAIREIVRKRKEKQWTNTFHSCPSYSSSSVYV